MIVVHIQLVVISDICEVLFRVCCGSECRIAQPLNATFGHVSVLCLSSLLSIAIQYSRAFFLKKTYTISTGFLLVLIYRMRN